MLSTNTEQTEMCRFVILAARESLPRTALIGFIAPPVSSRLVLAHPYLLHCVLAHSHRATHLPRIAPDYLRIVAAHFSCCAAIVCIVVVCFLTAPTIHHFCWWYFLYFFAAIWPIQRACPVNIFAVLSIRFAMPHPALISLFQLVSPGLCRHLKFSWVCKLIAYAHCCAPFVVCGNKFRSVEICGEYWKACQRYRQKNYIGFMLHCLSISIKNKSRERNPLFILPCPHINTPYKL